MPNPLIRKRGNGSAAQTAVRLPPVLNIAHRGARAFAPENTIPAFLKGIELFGCPAVELDVHLTKDGELVVVHDDDLKRTTPDVLTKFPGAKSYYVSDFTLAQLKTLDAGSWFVEQIKLPPAKRQWFLQTLTDEEIAAYIPEADQKLYSSGEVRLPTLEESLMAVFSRSDTAMVNIEIKMLPRMYPGLTQKIIDLVAKLKCTDRVLLSCFDHHQVTVAREHMAATLKDPHAIPVAALFSDRPGKCVEYLELIDADAYNPGCLGDSDTVGFNHVDGTLDSAGFMKGCIAAGMGVNVWTENVQARMKAMIDAKVVTGIFTDYPNRMAAALKEAGLPTSSELVAGSTTLVAEAKH
ncbi:glycerophosphoryl diester phosphodiesterase [Hyaloraphidium curvatum]|nr:glycerophosphoryl diester phosphodiesterase [Hyaloraphidium curvatum]